MPPTAAVYRFLSILSLALVLVVSGLGAGCMSAEQKMVLKVENLMEQGRYDAALTYLERYLGRYGKSLAAWRYRVLIRLDQEQRPVAAAEYSALSDSLGRHEPDVLREVVLGAGGRWLLSDYAMLARCAAPELVDAAFFEQLLTAQLLGSGSMSKVAVSDDEIAAVVDALPGALDPSQTWPLLEERSSSHSAGIRSRLVLAAGRHLVSGALSDEAVSVALQWVSEAAGEADPRLREAALHVALQLPAGPGRADRTAGLVSSLVAADDPVRSVSLFLLGPGRSGPDGWSREHLDLWAATALEPLATFALAALQQRDANVKRGRILREAAESQNAPRMLAAATVPGARPAEVWAGLHVEDRRTWGPALVRSAAQDRGLWAGLALGDSDSLVVQASADALALTGWGADEPIDTALRAALGARASSARAAAAHAVIVRGAASLKPELEALAQAGDERVMTAALAAVVETGAAGWDSLAAAGLKADNPLLRERAVDASVAGCSDDQRPLLTALLTDDDPHVAVRAAAVLYLSLGSLSR